MNKNFLFPLAVLFISYSLALSLDKISHSIYHQNYASTVDNCIVAKTNILVSGTSNSNLQSVDAEALLGSADYWYKKFRNSCIETTNHQDNYNLFTYIKEILIGRTE